MDRPNRELSGEERHLKKQLKNLLKQEKIRKKHERRRLNSLLVLGQDHPPTTPPPSTPAGLDEGESQSRDVTQTTTTTPSKPALRTTRSDLPNVILDWEIKMRQIIQSIYRQHQREMDRGPAVVAVVSPANPKGTTATLLHDSGLHFERAIMDSSSTLRGTSFDSALPSSAQFLKQFRNAQARILLQNMTRGTLTPDMLQDPEALRGYTRHKFHERAVWIGKAWHRLVHELIAEEDPIHGPLATDGSGGVVLGRRQARMIQALEQVQSVCSIGCGPAGDVVGYLAWRRVLGDTTGTPGPLRRLIWFDWAMPAWADTILKPLERVLVPNWSQHIVMATCDVRQGLSSNAAAQDALRDSISHHQHHHHHHHQNSPPSAHWDVDLFISCYLLSEVRDQWSEFYHDLLEHSRPGTLFLFCEPTAWQLHQLLAQWNGSGDKTHPVNQVGCSETQSSSPTELHEEEEPFLHHMTGSPINKTIHCTMPSHGVDYLWIDSSMHCPELQPLERRVGPAILVVQKR